MSQDLIKVFLSKKNIFVVKEASNRPKHYGYQLRKDLKEAGGLLDIAYALLLMGMLAMAFNIQLVEANPGTIIVPDEYSSIQEAINHARTGDTVQVKAGIYLEHIVVDKEGLRLLGENGDTTIIDGNGTGTVVCIKANNTVFSGFTVQNSGCNMHTRASGIYLDQSFNTSVSSNSVINNNLGIYLYESPNSILKNNNMVGNRYNFGVFGLNLKDYIHNIDVSNVVDGEPIIYWVNQANKQPPPNAGYVAIVNSTTITVENLTLAKNWQALLFAYTTNSSIKNVTTNDNMDAIWLHQCSGCSIYSSNVSDNIWGGIALVNSSGCSVYENDINNNGEYGIFLSYTSDNVFYHNNIIDNRRQAWLHDFNNNTWDDGYPSGGNYWSDYVGADRASDGIGDTPYVIDSLNKDCYPLMKPRDLVLPEEPRKNIILYVIAGIGAIVIILGIGIYAIKLRKRPSDDGFI